MKFHAILGNSVALCYSLLGSSRAFCHANLYVSVDSVLRGILYNFCHSMFSADSAMLRHVNLDVFVVLGLLFQPIMRRCVTPFKANLSR